MAKALDQIDPALARLRALRAEKPLTQAGQVRWAWPEIKAALAVGHSLKTIHQRMAEAGIRIPYRRLSYYLTRLRREEGQSPTPLAAPPTPNVTPSDHRSPSVAVPPTAPHSDAAPGPNPAARDPLANLRKLSDRRPGFHWDEAPPDKNKLL
jgi:hypothetical protein